MLWCTTIGHTQPLFNFHSAQRHSVTTVALKHFYSINSTESNFQYSNLFTFLHDKAHPRRLLWDRVTQLMTILNTLDVSSLSKNTFLPLRGVTGYWLSSTSRSMTTANTSPEVAWLGTEAQIKRIPPVQCRVLDQGSNEKDCVTLAFVWLSKL